MFSKNVKLSLIDKVTTGTSSLALLIWDVGPAGCIADTFWEDGLASGLAGILGVFDISEIIQFFDHGKLNSISLLIKGKFGK